MLAVGEEYLVFRSWIGDFCRIVTFVYIVWNTKPFDLMINWEVPVYVKYNVILQLWSTGT